MGGTHWFACVLTWGELPPAPAVQSVQSAPQPQGPLSSPTRRCPGANDVAAARQTHDAHRSVRAGCSSGQPPQTGSHIVRNAAIAAATVIIAGAHLAIVAATGADMTVAALGLVAIASVAAIAAVAMSRPTTGRSSAGTDGRLTHRDAGADPVASRASAPRRRFRRARAAPRREGTSGVARQGSDARWRGRFGRSAPPAGRGAPRPARARRIRST